MKRLTGTVTLLICALLLGGCINLSPQPPTTRFFLLPESAERAIAVEEVVVARYLDQPQLVLTHEMELRFIPGARWAEPLGRTLERRWSMGTSEQVATVFVDTFGARRDKEGSWAVIRLRFTDPMNGEMRTFAWEQPWTDGEMKTLVGRLDEGLRAWESEVGGEVSDD